MPSKRTTPELDKLERLKQEFGDRPFSSSEATEAGVSRTTLHRFLTNGALESPSRGIYQLSGGGMGMQSELALVSARSPGATVCLNSALSYWDLTDESPNSIHIAIPRGTWVPRIANPKTKVHVFSAETFAIDRQQVTTDVGEPFWIYSPERSVIDAIRMARWVGRDVGLHALRRYMSKPGAKPGHLMELARQIGGTRSLAPAMEAILS